MIIDGEFNFDDLINKKDDNNARDDRAGVGSTGNAIDNNNAKDTNNARDWEMERQIERVCDDFLRDFSKMLAQVNEGDLKGARNTIQGKDENEKDN